jgi:hypothetical protein
MPAPFAHKFYPLADNIGQRNALTQILDEFGWYGHHPSVSQPTAAHNYPAALAACLQIS